MAGVARAWEAAAALDEPSLSGVVHATSPEPVRNAELMATLRTVLHRPWAPPTPALEQLLTTPRAPDDDHPG